jgi:16S rRNA processing protein RimM
VTDGSTLVLVGRLGAAHGVRGEIRLKSHTGDPAAIATYGPLRDPIAGRTFDIESLRHVRDDMFVARLKGVRDRAAAEALCNVDLYVERTMLPPPAEDEFYHSDLIGLEAVLESGEPFGKVLEVLNFGAGDILEIRPANGAEAVLLPFTRAVVPHVDIAAGKVTVAPPAEVEAKESETGQEP